MNRNPPKKRISPFFFLTLMIISIAFCAFISGTFFNKTIVLDAMQKNLAPLRPILSEKADHEVKSLENKKRNYRNYWEDYIIMPGLHRNANYLVGNEGLISHIEIPIINKTDFNIESITVKLIFYAEDGKNTLSSQYFDIKNIAANSSVSYPGPVKPEKGISVVGEIVRIQGSDFDFCYDGDMQKDTKATDGFSGNPGDPWKCK